MRLPIPWLKRYMDISLTPLALSDRLTMSGTKTEGVESVGHEDVIDIEITTNRPDCLSILGLAKEVSALTKKPMRFPKIEAKLPKKNFPHGWSLEILDKTACPYYTARLIEGVSIKPFPASEARLLELVKSRLINNVVDVTNWVLFEMGQPLHAFDADKLDGKTLIIRRAKSGEKFLALDGSEHALSPETLVIADQTKVVALAGVMGGKRAEVTGETKNIFLESAYFDPGLVRSASKKYKISTESSYRFERGVNPELVEIASRRARDLIVSLAGGRESVFLEKGSISKWLKKQSIGLEAEKLREALGVLVPVKRQVQILKSLGFQVKASSKGIQVAKNVSRSDVNIPEDLIEEIVRIEGFEKIPVAVPISKHSFDRHEGGGVKKTFELKKWLSAQGFSEILTYSFLSKKQISDCEIPLDVSIRQVRNPVSVDLDCLRPSLIPGLLGAMQFNVNRKNQNLKFFEIGNRFLNQNEEKVLALGLTGLLHETWKKKEEVSFFDLKGLLDNVAVFFGQPSFEYARGADFPKFAEDSCEVVLGKERLGFIGKVSARVRARWDLAQDCFVAEIALSDVLFQKGSHLKVRAIPKFPCVRRDLAIVVSESVKVEDVTQAVIEAGVDVLKDIQLFDEYRGKNIPSGKKSLAFSLAYQKEGGTFTDEEIVLFQAKVSEALKQKLKAEFR